MVGPDTGWGGGGVEVGGEVEGSQIYGEGTTIAACGQPESARVWWVSLSTD